jgi:hypothetical protein
VHDDVVADLDVLDVLAGCPDDAARIGATDVERLGLALLLARLDHVDRHAHRGPHVVVIDARGHHVDQDVAWAELGDGDGFLLERIARLAEPLGADQLGEHALRHDAEVRDLAERVEIAGRGSGGGRHDEVSLRHLPPSLEVSRRSRGVCTCLTSSGGYPTRTPNAG